MLILCLSEIISRPLIGRKLETSRNVERYLYDIARLLLMVPLEPWQNSTPFFCAAAFCTTKNGDFRTSSTLSSLMTWLRRPLRKDQLRGTVAALCATKIDDFRASSTLSSLTTWLRRPLKKDQLRGIAAAFCTTKIDDFRVSSTGMYILQNKVRTRAGVYLLQNKVRTGA